MSGQLRDIKPLLEIPDNSYTIFIVLSLFMVLLILTLLFIFFRKFFLNRKKNMKKVYLQRIKNVDWKYPKQAAYEVTHLGRLLADEPRAEEIYNQLVPMLEPYKYRKSVPPIDEAALRQYNLLVHILDETV
jgi:hypothetical protein